MGRGRGTGIASAHMLAFLCMLLHTHMANAAVYTVGDGRGWDFNTVGWTKGKTFHAGDVLVFKYNPSVHNVVVVNAVGYEGCTVPSGSKVYSSGNDRVVLWKGPNYFICSFAGHCNAGMKIAVTAA